MKVVQINATCGYGSTGNICLELSRHMSNNNIENYIFYGNGSSDYENAQKFNSKLDIKIHGLFSRITGTQAYFSKHATINMLNKIEMIKPDIVHLHNLHGNYINLNMLLDYLIRMDIATVITLHDCWFMTGKCTHYTSDKCYKWINGCEKCVRLKKDNVSWFIDRTQKMWMDKKERFNKLNKLGVVGVSDWITNEAKKSYLKKAFVIKRIYNWIDTDIFFPRNSNIRKEYGIPNGVFVISMISASWKKDSDKFEDMVKLSEQLSDSIKIILIGKVDSDSALPKNVISVGYIADSDKLALLYSISDVYIHLSREDTFGKVVAEAMACGVPAIVYNSTALPELIGEKCGYTVEVGSIHEIIKKIKLIKENTKEFYTNNCVNYVKNNFEKDKLINSTIELYKEILAENC